MNPAQEALYRRFIMLQTRNLSQHRDEQVVDFVLLSEKDKIILFKAWAVEQETKTDAQIANLPADTQKLQDDKALYGSIAGLS